MRLFVERTLIFVIRFPDVELLHLVLSALDLDERSVFSNILFVWFPENGRAVTLMLGGFSTFVHFRQLIVSIFIYFDGLDNFIVALF